MQGYCQRRLRQSLGTQALNQTGVVSYGTATNGSGKRLNRGSQIEGGNQKCEKFLKRFVCQFSLQTTTTLSQFSYGRVKVVVYERQIKETFNTSC